MKFEMDFMILENTSSMPHVLVTNGSNKRKYCEMMPCHKSKTVSLLLSARSDFVNCLTL